MNASTLHGLALFLMLLSSVGPVRAGDPLVEAELDQSLAAQLRQGDFIWLELPGHRVGAVHTPAGSRVRQKGGVILLHDRGHNPDWPGLMRPLRTGLARAGWESLAVQMPISAVAVPAALLQGDREQALARIAAAVAWFKAHKVFNLVLIGHGLGATFALAYLESIQAQAGQAIDAPATEPRIAALVLIGVLLPEPLKTKLLAGLETLETPVLDLYGSRDYAVVLAQAGARLAAARRAQNSHYQQFRFPEAGHDFDALQTPLSQRLRGWLERVAPATEIPTADDPEETDGQVMP